MSKFNVKLSKISSTGLEGIILESDILRVKEMKEEIEKISITPNTFISRDINFDEYWYVDKYSHGNNNVLRYGIDSLKLNNEDISKSNLPIYNLLDKDDISVKSSIYKAEDASKVKHHPIEIKLMKSAIEHLLSSQEIKTVLVHIFARQLNKIGEMGIKIINGPPETHTVVLFKNPADKSGKHDIAVIDPSNFLFSSHLSNQDVQGQVKHDLLSRIITFHKGTQLYKVPEEKSKKGTDSDEFRDCLDIAVKLAFGFNYKSSRELSYKIDIDLKEFQRLDDIVLKSISNDSKIDKDLNTSFKNIPLRIKQTSDPELVLAFYRAEQLIDKRIKVDKTYDQDSDSLFQKYSQVLQEYNSIKGNAKQVYNTLTKLVSSHTEDLKFFFEKEEKEFKSYYASKAEETPDNELLGVTSESHT